MTDFDTVLRAAINDITNNGSDEERLTRWLKALRDAAHASLMPPASMKAKLGQAYRAIMEKLVGRGGALKRHEGVERFTLEMMKPQLHAELNNRIFASAELIKLNREEEIEKTMRRFAGWAISVPREGSKTTNKKEEAENIRKSLAGLSFRERRVLIDQGQKLTSAIHDIIATDGGAIAAKWVSHWHQQNYDYREDHKDRMLESAKKPYVIRDNWALQNGLMKLGGAKYTDEITQPGEEPFCQCYYDYIYQLSALPQDMLTAKGRAAIAAAKAK